MRDTQTQCTSSSWYRCQYAPDNIFINSTFRLQSYPIQAHLIQSNPIQSDPNEAHPIHPSHPIQSDPISSNPIPFHPIQSYPISSNPISLYLNLFCLALFFLLSDFSFKLSFSIFLRHIPEVDPRSHPFFQGSADSTSESR